MSDRRLFEPVSLSAYTLKNRIVISSPSRMRAVDGVPGSIMQTYYAQRADAGLIISEPTLVTPTTSEYSSCPGIYSFEQVLAWREVTKAVRDRDGKIFLQLWHGEGVSPQCLTQRYYDFTVAPDYENKDKLLEAIVDRDRRIEVLIDLVDIIGSIWDYERVGVRICPTNIYSGNNSPDPELEFYSIVDFLNSMTLAYFYVQKPLQHSFLTFEYEDVSNMLRPVYDKILTLDGDDELDLDTMAEKADLIAFETAGIANPDLAVRLKQNAPLNQYDPTTLYGGDEKGYIDYPFWQGL